MNKFNFTIGADPELFIINEKTGKVVSAIGLIPGEKGNPYTAEDMPNGFGLETDNILAEFNIPAVTSKEAFINNIEYMKNYINNFVKEKNPELGILCAASQEVDPSELNHPQAQLFGCDVDFNVYTQRPNPKPEGDKTNLRSAGFHIHVGYPENNIDKSLRLIKYLDFYLGLPSIIFDPDSKRRSLYGKAGSFRLKPYGFEYRVLSSALLNNTSHLEFIWNQIGKAFSAELDSYELPKITLISNIINTSDLENAKKFVQQYNLI